MTTDEFYMQRCIELAEKGRTNVRTNPMVGCVIVHNGRIIGEGYHRKYGEAHAEVNAIQSVADTDKDLLSASTLYVNLEPCCHYGKTPPCSNLIIDHKIPKVVIGMQDPFPLVAGGGITMLRDAGIEVEVNILEKECRYLNRRFITFHEKKRPYVIFKWAQTIDGYIDNDREPDTPPTWLTNTECKRLVHKWRTEESAIIVGSETIKRDNPQLTAREWYGPSPLRLTIDRQRQLLPSGNIFKGDAPTVIFTQNSTDIPALSESYKYVGIDFKNGLWMQKIMDYLYKQNILSMIVEGGTQLFNLFLENNYFDEARIFVSPLMLSELKGGHGNGIKAPELPKGTNYEHTVIEDVLLKTVLF